MAEIITAADLPASTQTHELVEAMVAGANAKASRVAPCLTWDGSTEDEPAPSADSLAEAKLVLIGAVKRWAETAAGAYQSQSAGPFGVTVDTRQRLGYNLWPSEIETLQDICSTGTTGREAFSLDTTPTTTIHLAWCSIYFGSEDCSCGADIAGVPIYELGDYYY